jgi:DNA repair protein RadD
MQLRHYQQSAINAVYDYIRNKDGNPCVVLPTAAGKTPLLATICRDAVQLWNGRVLVLAHVKELLQQAADKLQLICPDVPVGVYSAGLRSRETDKPVIVAGIQSVYKRACELDRFDLIIVDECHMLPPEGEGMYQSFLRDAKVVNPHVRLIGLTATPYRMKSGALVGENNLLNEICYEIGVRELIEEGFLCPLKSKSGRHKVDCTDLHIRAGEFVASEVDELMNTTDNVESACREIVTQTRDRHSVLIFGASVSHATRIKETIERFTNQECGIVTGETASDEREQILRRFKGETFAKDLLGTKTEPLKFLANVNVLTTGFDAPNIDCIVLLRPTASTGLYYQCCGRGFRLHESKTNCLVLDYGGNILRHGPVDAIQVREKKTNDNNGGDAPAKECPQCLSIVHAAVMTCPDCGYKFPSSDKEQHEANASDEGILTGEITDTQWDVESVLYSVHTKRGATEYDPRTLRVDYKVGFNEYKSEWVCPEHDGWARKKFEHWWKERSNNEPPTNAEQAVQLANAGSLSTPTQIVIRKVGGEKFERIIKYTLPKEKPNPIDETYENQYVEDVPF